MLTKPVLLGIVLFIITMIVFFIVYYFFGGIHYYDISLKINSFLLPAIYCIFAFVSVRSFWKKNGGIQFKEAFKRAFVPMFVGGFFSMLSIFVFLNFVDTEAKNMLNYQYVQSNRNELDAEYHKARSIMKNESDKQELDQKYRERLQSFEAERTRGKDMFTANHFAGYFAAILIFYMLLSLFFGTFFRGRNL
ncbi:MAG: DUF4199 domain-containing protein [Flavobacteriaceae bacterium]|jgi:hypothetical protein|nr:DUF4199 domain-containing protein [Flavobacteriaceae bacterium]